MHNMLLDSTLPFRSGPGAEGIQIRTGSNLASVFHASGAEVWRGLPRLYLGLSVRFFGARCMPWNAPSQGEKCVAPGVAPALPAHAATHSSHAGDVCDTRWGGPSNWGWKRRGQAGPMPTGHGGGSECLPST